MEKSCVERGSPTAQWSSVAVDQDSGRLLGFIQTTRLNQIPDQELLIRLGIVVDFFARETLLKTDLAASTLKNFALHGETLFRQTLDMMGSGKEESAENVAKDSLCTDAEVPLPCDGGEA